MKLGVSPGAIHDSAERYSSPNCHPSTRKAGRRIVLNWIHRESSAYSFFWLYGPAGAGKTAIFQAILCSPSGILGEASSPERRKGDFLFSSIAY